MSTQTLLDRLHGVKPTGPGRWLARCPAHEDRSPSLSIRELDDGRVLVHDFGGCDTQAVLDALGLTLADLFERPLRGAGPAGGYAPSHSRIAAGDALAAIDHEVVIAALLIECAADGNKLDGNARARLRKACARIGAARDLVRPAEVRRA